MQFAAIEARLEDLIDPLLALHTALADELIADDQCVKMMPVAVEFKVGTIHPGEDELFDLIGVHHRVQPLNFQPRRRSSSVSKETAAKQTTTTLRLFSGETSETPKKP